MFNAPVAIETYAKVFEEEGALDKLEAFASLNGPKHYRMPPNEETITLEKTAWTAPQEVKVAGPDERALVYRGGETIEWKVVSKLLNRLQVRGKCAGGRERAGGLRPLTRVTE